MIILTPSLQLVFFRKVTEKVTLRVRTFQGQIQIQNTSLSVAIVTVKQKIFFAHTSSARLNNGVKLI